MSASIQVLTRAIQLLEILPRKDAPMCLAELVGVRRETIVNLEKGKYNPSLKLAMDIAKVFHTTVEELFFFDD